MKLGLFTLMLSVSGLFYAQDNKGTSDSNAFTSVLPRWKSLIITLEDSMTGQFL